MPRAALRYLAAFAILLLLPAPLRVRGVRLALLICFLLPLLMALLVLLLA